MFTILGLKYAALVFVAAVGVIQAAAAYNNLRGLSFFRQNLFNYVFAIVTIGVPMSIFFTWNYHFPIGDIAGSQQAGLFFLTIIAAGIFTVIVSSIVNYKLCSTEAAELKGFDALREGSYFRTIRERITGKY